MEKSVSKIHRNLLTEKIMSVFSFVYIYQISGNEIPE